MRDFATRFFYCTIVLSSLLLANEAVAQGQSADRGDKDTFRLALGSTSGEPGESVVVPVYFTPADTLQVSRLDIHVTFVSANLKFDNVEPGIAAEMGNVKISHDLQLGKNDKGIETSSLSLLASAPESASQGIPSGLLAYIQLKISPSGRPATISLRTTVEATEKGNNRKLDQMTTPDATVEVIAPGSEPAVVCFFFTH
jgi:Cohesin domain